MLIALFLLYICEFRYSVKISVKYTNPKIESNVCAVKFSFGMLQLLNYWGFGHSIQFGDYLLSNFNESHNTVSIDIDWLLLHS